MAERLEFVIFARDKFSKAFGKLRSALPSLRTVALGTSAAVTGLGVGLFAMAKSTATAHDQIGKFAGRIGVTTEALSAYQHVADLSGISTAALNVGWQRMTRRISEAAEGTGIAKDALVELGLSAENINKLSPDKQFEAIAGALEGVASQGDKVRLAMKFWDTEGVGLLQTLQGGTAGLKEMREEAEKFGLVVSEEAAKNAAEFNDNLTRLTGSLRGVKNEIGEELMPTLSGFIGTLANFIAEYRPQIVGFFRDALTWTARFVEKGSLFVARFVDGWVGLKLMWLDLKIAFWEFQKSINERLVKLSASLTHFMESINFRGMFDEGIERSKRFEENFSRNAAGIEKHIAGLKEEFADILGAETAEAKTKAFFEKFKIMMEDLAESGSGSMEKIVANTEKAVITSGEKLTELEEQAKNTWDSFSEGLGDSVGAMAVSGENLAKSMSKVFKSIISSVISGIVQIGVQRLALGLLSIGVNTAESTAKMSAIAGETYGASFASAAAIPIIGWEIAPGIAAANTSIMLAGATGSASAGAGVGAAIGAAHGGLTRVPREQTYLLNQGERVLSPEQNRDLSEFIGGEAAQGETVVIEKVEVNSPLVRENWDRIAERFLAPAISRARRRRVSFEE